MKFIHTADLHLGKIVNGFSMLDDQEYILNEIIKIIDEEEPDGILIAGDVYDKTSPSSPSVALFDDFLYELTLRELEIFIISGNHDSPQRLAFGGRIMEKSRVHISPVYEGNAEHIILEDEFGPLNVYLLPFIKPAQARPFFPENKIEDYTDAVRCAVKAMRPDENERNILVAHQFVTGAVTFRSEELSIGGLDNVDADVFDAFDYVALGHLHGPQNIGSERIRYAGTPLKYSFSECSHKKSVTIVELKEKGDLNVSTRKLSPARDMKEIRGEYAEVTLKDFYKDPDLKDAYLHITLTDEEDIPEALGRLKAIYPNLMKLDYDNKRTRSLKAADETNMAEDDMDPLDIFKRIYEAQNNSSLSEKQEELLRGLIEEIWE